jgi:hypothetical protein
MAKGAMLRLVEVVMGLALVPLPLVDVMIEDTWSIGTTLTRS